MELNGRRTCENGHGLFEDSTEWIKLADMEKQMHSIYTYKT